MSLSGAPHSPGAHTHSYILKHTHQTLVTPPCPPVPPPPFILTPDATPLEVRVACVCVCVCLHCLSLSLPPAKADTSSPQLPFSSARLLLEYSRFRLFSLREGERKTEYKNMQMLLLKRRMKEGGGAPFTPPHLPCRHCCHCCCHRHHFHLRPSIYPCRVRERGDIQVAQQGQVIKNILKGHHYLYQFRLFPPKSSGRPTDISEKEGRKCAAI